MPEAVHEKPNPLLCGSLFKNPSDHTDIRIPETKFSGSRLLLGLLTME